MRVFISGQKYFAEQVLRLCLRKGLDVVGVCCPIHDHHVGALAYQMGIPTIEAGTLTADTFPAGVDLGITAHSFDYVGMKTRYKARLGWIGYHPSLLPRHRGRSAIEWAIRMGDDVTGGTVFWLNSGIDRGDIAAQDWCFIDPRLRTMKPSEAASELWHDTLLDMGLSLFDRVLDDIAAGRIVKRPQDNRFSTWEPTIKENEIYRPDALMLTAQI